MFGARKSGTPRAFQLLTVVWRTPNRDASAVTDPAYAIADRSPSRPGIIFMPRNITYRDFIVNTIRVRFSSRSVKNERMDFSARLRTLRKRAGMTQEQLALACGWTGQSRVSNYESSGENSRKPDIEELPVLARALNVSTDELLGIVPSSTSQPSRLNHRILANALTIARAEFHKRKLSPNDKALAAAQLIAYEELVKGVTQQAAAKLVAAKLRELSQGAVFVTG